MLDRGVVGINQKSSLSLEEANLVIKVISKFTKEISERVDQLINQLESLGPGPIEKTKIIEKEVNELIESWNAKVRKLGGIPKGLWFVDIDAGDGYYCWKYPESELLYWHDYRSGYTGRMPISEAKEEVKPVINENRISSNQPNTWGL